MQLKIKLVIGYILSSFLLLNPGPVGAQATRTDSTAVQPDTLVLGGTQAAVATQPESPETIQSFLRKGKFRGHGRAFTMATDNTGNYPDYYAQALGLGLYYESAPFHGLQVGVGGSFIFNVWSNDLGTDPETGLNSRYEIGNFDLLDPDDKGDLARLEHLYLRYKYKKSQVTLGRQQVNTPFLNPQDGRMRPTLVNALWFQINELDKLSFQGGWVFGIGPRSTQDFFPVGQSIASIPAGRSALGGPSQFVGNISSSGMAVGQVAYEPIKQLKSTLTHYYVNNLFNFTMWQNDVNLPVNKERGQAIVLGLQAAYQQASGDGGNPDPQKAYILPDASTWFYSTRIGYKTDRFVSTLNYTRIADKDRFLMPREWGIEAFYTFIPRERLEGTADTRAIAWLTDVNLNKRWKATVGMGLTDMPDVQNVAQNKYAMPSYSILQLRTDYSFQGMLDGLDLMAMYIYKGERGNTYDNPNFIVNKVDMSHYSLVLNYRF